MVSTIIELIQHRVSISLIIQHLGEHSEMMQRLRYLGNEEDNDVSAALEINGEGEKIRSHKNEDW